MSQTVPTRSTASPMPAASLAATPHAMRMRSKRPASKVMAASGAALVVQVLVLASQMLGGPEPTPELVGAVTVIVTALAGYLMPPGSRDEVVRLVDPAGLAADLT
ncbi:MAG: hypothetical protein AAF675_01200 [Pseudomonadota bacterium]